MVEKEIRELLGLQIPALARKYEVIVLDSRGHAPQKRGGGALIHFSE
jgi:hypothetical protein